MKKTVRPKQATSKSDDDNGSRPERATVTCRDERAVAVGSQSITGTHENEDGNGSQSAGYTSTEPVEGAVAVGSHVDTGQGPNENGNGSRSSSATNEPVHERVIANLIAVTRRREYALRSRLQVERRLSMFINRFLSPPGLPKGEFQKALSKTDMLIRNYRKTGDPIGLPVQLIAEIDQDLEYWKLIDEREERFNKQIEKLAKQLPVYDWWNSNPGMAAGGLGLIVGNAGNIGTFRKAAGLWQRMGMRNVRFQACSTWMREKGSDKLTKQEWADIGYNGRRRSVMWNVVDSLLKKQRKKLTELPAKEAQELHPRERWYSAGQYGELAIERYEVALETHPDWKPMHRQLDVNRVVGKWVLADLLKQWKAVS